MHTRIPAITAALLLSASFPAFANDTEGGYLGGGVLGWIYADEATDGSANGTGVQLRGGYRFNNRIALETRFNSGGEGTVDGIDVQLNRAVQFLFMYNFGQSERTRSSVYAGLSTGELEFSAFGFSARESDTGLSFGLNVEHQASDTWSLYGDFGILQWGSIDGTEYILTGFSAGAAYHF